MGDEVAIMVDYIQSLQPVEAVRRLRVVGTGLAWNEAAVSRFGA